MSQTVICHTCGFRRLVVEDGIEHPTTPNTTQTGLVSNAKPQPVTDHAQPDLRFEVIHDREPEWSGGFSSR